MKDYILALFIGFMLTPSAIEYANSWRGYKAFGGECLIVPVLILAIYIWHEWKYVNKDVESNETH